MGTPLPKATVRTLVTTHFARYAVDVVTRGTHTFLVHNVLMEICYLESGFDPTAVGAAGEVGLFQIHPVNWPQYGMNAAKLKEPSTNVGVARKIFDDMGGTDGKWEQAFSPWTTYEQAIRNLSERGEQDEPVDNTHPGVGSGPIPGVGLITDWADGIKKFFNIILDPTFWKRIGIGYLGALIIIGAIVLWNKDTITETAEVIK